MNKIEFISMAFPFGIKMFGIKAADDIEREDYILNVYFIDKEDCYCGNKNRIIGKPILRPLSDLTKEIEHKGEKFVPISILFDLESGTKWSSTDYLIHGNSKIEFYTYFKEKPTFYFGYNREKNSFYSVNQFGFHQIVNNQICLFKKLLEWHFDIFGLIEKNEAIDYHTIPDFVF